MKRIYKYPLVLGDTQIDLREDAQVLAVQTQAGLPQLWALVDDDADMKRVPLRIYGTGHEAPDAENLNYVGTFQQAGGALIWHVFVGYKV